MKIGEAKRILLECVLSEDRTHLEKLYSEINNEISELCNEQAKLIYLSESLKICGFFREEKIRVDNQLSSLSVYISSFEEVLNAISELKKFWDSVEHTVSLSE